MLISLENGTRNLSLGSSAGLINHNNSVSLWILLYTAMVPSLDFNCKRDSFSSICLLACSYNELLS